MLPVTQLPPQQLTGTAQARGRTGESMFGPGTARPAADARPGPPAGRPAQPPLAGGGRVQLKVSRPWSEALQALVRTEDAHQSVGCGGHVGFELTATA